MNDIAYTSTTEHVGDMRCHTVYNGKKGDFCTDVPAEKGGKGEYPTPGEMLVSCVASCMLSMLCYKGRSKGLDTMGMSINAGVEEDGAGISALHFDIYAPMPTSEEQRLALEAAARACPVGKAIHPNIEKVLHWHWR